MGFEMLLEGGTHSAGVGGLRMALSPSHQRPESSPLALGPMVAVTPGGITCLCFHSRSCSWGSMADKGHLLDIHILPSLYQPR